MKNSKLCNTEFSFLWWCRHRRAWPWWEARQVWYIAGRWPTIAVFGIPNIQRNLKGCSAYLTGMYCFEFSLSFSRPFLMSDTYTKLNLFEVNMLTYVFMVHMINTAVIICTTSLSRSLTQHEFKNSCRGITKFPTFDLINVSKWDRAKLNTLLPYWKTW